MDPAVKYDKTMMAMVGSCYEHTSGIDLKVRDLATLQRLKGYIDEGRVHANCHAEGARQAKEALVVSIAPFANENYHCRAVLMASSCKSGGHEHTQMAIIKNVEHLWRSLGWSEKFGPISGAYSDGDAARRLVFTKDEKEIFSGNLAAELDGLLLFDNATSPGEMSRAFDMKHIFKRLRAVFKSQTRGTITGALGEMKVTSSSAWICIRAPI